MVGSNGTMIAIRLVRSKLRKREEHSATGNDGVVHAADVVQLQHRTTTHQLNLGALHHNNSHSGSFPHHHHIERTMTANNINHNNNNHLANRGLVQIAATPASGLAATQMTIIPSAQLDHQQHVSAEPLAYRGQFLWQYPTPMQQYNNDQTNVQHLTEEQQRSQGLVRGLRKNLGGRWRRLVRRKPAPDMCGAIPAELKPQLKQIYVY